MNATTEIVYGDSGMPFLCDDPVHKRRLASVTGQILKELNYLLAVSVS